MSQKNKTYIAITLMFILYGIMIYTLIKYLKQEVTMNKQTSIEWYAQKDTEITIQFLEGKLNQIQLAIEKTKCLEQAKQMHKKEIIKILNKREDYLGTQSNVFDYLTNEEWFEQYYQETYGSSPKTSDNGPEYDSAGFTEEDRIVNGQYRVKL